MTFPVSSRLGFGDLIDRLSGEAPRRDTERLLFSDLRPELRERKTGAIRLPRADGSRLALTEFFQFMAGIAQRALSDPVELVRSRSRNYYHGTADEPVIQAAIGVASAKAFAATATVNAATTLLAQSWHEPRDFALSLEAALAASRAKITVESLALAVIDALTQVASGSMLSTERALDRHWRNLKVLASHNPSIYKQQVLGAYELHGTQPPLSVYF